MTADIERDSCGSNGSSHLGQGDQHQQVPPSAPEPPANEVKGEAYVPSLQPANYLTDKEKNGGGVSFITIDKNSSVVGLLDATGSLNCLQYSPYGYRSFFPSILGFNGQHADSATGYYPLGNGYRMFIPSLMRFNSPDSMSPFEAGGMNSYVYCLGDPVNWQDASGHMPSRPIKELSLPDRVFSHQSVVKVENFISYKSVRRANMNIVTHPPRDVSSDHQLLALHGSGDIHKQSLEMGIDKRFAVRGKYGAAFYASPDYRVAAYFSHEHKKGARLFGVYGRDVQDWVEGRDYKYSRTGWLMILEPAFEKVKIREEIRMPIRVLDSSTPGVRPYSEGEKPRRPYRQPRRQ
ncbi:RHS repeat-associated core domain-containing protein [Pseudomonas mosselii]|uniref:RHS repeat-associated core domain-containing protein n=1 Tax=Pseudomonas mosselii TaxID=78327 RepID=UPI000D8BFF81|nr:RHS repeat-associated core domain-containing protein [Pseudomonas mosselii]PYC23954.1 hypothetical protein DMX06_08930 [Pseudomonas mosselii]